MSSFVDMGSQCTLLKEEYMTQLNLPVETNNLPTLTGFANGTLVPKGRVRVQIELEGLNEWIDAYLIESKYLPADILIGQTLTELPHVRIYKTDNALIFYKELQVEESDNNKIRITADNDVVLTAVMSVSFRSEPDVCGSIYVNPNPCMKKDHEYMILPGVYSINEGIGSVIAVNLSS